MTEITQKILADWQVRKTKKQKTAFIEFLRGYYPELQVEQNGLLGSRNLVIGDVASAKVVYTAHYDTCAFMPVPNFITPKNIIYYLIYSLILAALILAAVFAVGFAVGFLTRNFWLSYWVGLVTFVLVLYLMMAGPANRHTVNDNTSGVVSLCELMAAMTEEERAKAAFVFFDYEELGLIGSAHFRSRHRQEMKEKLLVNLDCVSDGDYIMLVQSKRARQTYGDKLAEIFTSSGEKKVLLERTSTAFYPSDQYNFPVSVGVAALNRKPVLGYYLSRIHTNRDTVFDEKNIEYLTERLCRLTREL